MKRTIDRILHVADLAIYAFEAYLAECHDLNFVRSSWALWTSVIAAQDACRVYYTHWFKEFTPAQLSRYRSIMNYDATRAHVDYLDRYGEKHIGMQNCSDLPF